LRAVSLCGGLDRGRTLDYPWLLAAEDGSPLPQSSRGAVKAVRTGQSQPAMVVRVGRPDGTWAWVRSSSVVLRDSAQVPYAVITTFVDITELRHAQEQAEGLVRELQFALENVRTLEGLLPICMYCKAIRDGAGAWSSVEAYVTKRTEAAFSHGICPSCFTKHVGDD
jgi:hypothetical protein